jgi:putative glutamine amidotransferase
MAQRPLIGIAMQTLEAQPPRLPVCWVMGQRYVKVLTAAGGVPWLLPLLPDEPDVLRSAYERLDGVLVAGGVDIDPGQYGEERHARCDRSDPARDWTEMRLIRWALEDGKPVLGVCRGVQALNVACGGSLYQDVADQYAPAFKHDYFPNGEYTRDYLAHPVEVRPGSRLGRLLGEERLLVNSMHHQGLKALGKDLTAVAFAPDGLVEGVERPGDAFVVGVQWHPEELTDKHPPTRRLFAAFVAAAADPRNRSAATRQGSANQEEDR